MKRSLLITSITVVALGLSACNDTPSGLAEDDFMANAVIVTEGIAAPAPTLSPALSTFNTPTASLGGSSTTPVSLKANTCSEGASADLSVTYHVAGSQVGTATFKVNRTWTYNGSTWTGSSPATISVPPQGGGATTSWPVAVTLINNSAAGAGTSSVSIPTFDLTNSNAQGAKLSGSASATVHVVFASCAVPNTPPSLTLPEAFTAEATSSAGANVSFVVSASDAEDGDLSGAVSCAPASGSLFPFGATTVTCSVTDSRGETATGSFSVTVEDTIPPDFTAFPSDMDTKIASNANGWGFQRAAYAIAAADHNGVSEPVAVSCAPADGTMLAIGSTTEVGCTATDARGNSSASRTFRVFVGLNVNAAGFMPALRMSGPYSVHKRGSTIPHKLLVPTYADGTPAVDLAGGLSLVVKKLDGSVDPASIEGNDYSAGSTTWRYEDGHYLFNLKTMTASPWTEGTWKTTVAYAGIQLAQTQFDLRR